MSKFIKLVPVLVALVIVLATAGGFPSRTGAQNDGPAADVADLSKVAEPPMGVPAALPLSGGKLPTVLYDNGPLVTHAGQGAGGADASALQTALGMTVYGFGNQMINGNRLADDFSVPSGGWYVDTITFFGYQTGSTTTSTFTSVNLRIWNGPPNNITSQIVFGDTTTNRLVSSTWSNIYRVRDTSITNAERPVMAILAAVNTFFPSGTYWLDWQVDGSAALLGPFVPPVTILGQTTTGNALQYIPTTGWQPVLDSGTNTPQDFPFLIGSGQGGAITINEIEVNQVLGSQYQGAQNYVAGKDTVVRVYLSAPVAVSSFSQRLEVRRNGNLVATLAPQPYTQPTQVLTFICPSRAVCSNWQEGVYAFRATIGSANAQKAATFSLRRTLRILAVPVKVNDQGTIKRPDDSWKSGDVFLKHVYPVAADGVTWDLGAELDASSYDLTQQGSCPKIGPWGPGQCRLWKDLKDRQPFLCGLPGRPACYDMIVGFIPAMRTVCLTQCETCGCTLGWTYGSPATIVMTNGTFETPCPNRPTIEVNDMRSIVAHEFGHTFADPLGDEYDNPFGQYRCDTNPPPPNYEGTYWGGTPTCSSADRCTNSTEQPWPNATGTGSLIRSDAARPFEINPTLPGSPTRGALPDMLSFMGSGSYQRDMWVTPRAYDHLFDQLAPTMMTEWVPTDSVDAVLVSGWIGQDGSVGLDPWYQASVTLGDPATGAYSVEAINSTGQVLASQGFDVSFVVLNNPPQIIDPAPFEAVVASPSGTAAFRIKHGATVLTEVPVSLHAPTVQVTAPTAGQVLSGPSAITWLSQDQDGDELYHTVEYSSDGQEWQVLTAAITQTQFVADFAALAGSTSAQVRITVSDGVNTATATSPAFTVVRTPPEVTIYAPDPGGLNAWASTITFSGGAYDYRDGWLRDPANLTWSSDRNGALGGGELLSVSTLSPGLHIITLFATNSANLTASTTISLTVGAKGDVNGDGCVLVDDITAIATAWTEFADPPLDLDGDGMVTVADIMIVAAGWDGQCVPAY